MLRNSIIPNKRKQMMYALRLSYLDCVEEQLEALRQPFFLPVTAGNYKMQELNKKNLVDLEKQFNESDRTMITLALKQTARAAIKQQKMDLLDLTGLLSIQNTTSRVTGMYCMSFRQSIVYVF